MSIVSDSVQPHRQQPTRLPHPWDSPGKNSGVGCHFLLQCMKVKSESGVAQSCPTLSDPMDCSLPGSSSMGFSRQEYWSGVPSPSPQWVYFSPNHCLTEALSLLKFIRQDFYFFLLQVGVQINKQIQTVCHTFYLSIRKVRFGCMPMSLSPSFLCVTTLTCVLNQHLC